MAIDLDEATFDHRAHEEMAYLEDSFADVDPDQVDVEVSDGVLRIELLKDGTKIVINSHRAARQIWMAAVSTAWHFDPVDDNKWVTPKTGEELRATLRALVHKRIGLTLGL
ncbi:MAG TPA: iron donor protein CyaY [Kofleriaceae bacterium]